MRATSVKKRLIIVFSEVGAQTGTARLRAVVKRGRRAVQEQGIMQTLVKQNAYVPNGNVDSRGRLSLHKKAH